MQAPPSHPLTAAPASVPAATTFPAAKGPPMQRPPTNGMGDAPIVPPPKDPPRRPPTPMGPPPPPGLAPPNTLGGVRPTGPPPPPNEASPVPWMKLLMT